MEAEGEHHDGLIRSVYPQSQSIILALVLFSIGIFPRSADFPAATESLLWGWIIRVHQISEYTLLLSCHRHYLSLNKDKAAQ